MRVILKQILARLTKWAIKKHDISVIAVLGEKQSRLTSYILWETLHKNNFVRCQWDRSFWDLAIPLTILGYEAKQRNPLEWVVLVFKASFVLLTQKAESQLIILHVPYSLPEILNYWFKLFSPDLVIAFQNDLNEERLQIIENNISRKRSNFVIIGKDVQEDWLTKNEITYDLPGVFWKLPVLASSFAAKKYGASTKDINKTLRNLEPLTFLKVREKIAE